MLPLRAGPKTRDFRTIFDDGGALQQDEEGARKALQQHWCELFNGGTTGLGKIEGCAEQHVLRLWAGAAPTCIP